MKRTIYLSSLLLLVACSKSGAGAGPEASVTSHDVRVPVVASSAAPPSANLGPVALSDIKVSAAASLVHVAWKIPEGTGVNDDAPFRLRWKSSEGLGEPPEDVTSTGGSVAAGFDVALKPTKGTATAKLVGVVELVVCDVKTHAVCVPVKRTMEMNFLVGQAQDLRVAVEVNLPAARAL